MMNILVIGRGGREHSIILKLKESKNVANIYAAPGNGGIASDATCVPIDEMDIDAIISFAKEASIDLTIVGPEDPLNIGIANRFKAEGLNIFAPSKEAALLEGSKSFAKQLMKKYNIPTAAYETFTDAESAKNYIEKKGAPIVIKADGLAAGKGVVVAETIEQALLAVDDMLQDKSFGEAGSKVVIEEFLAGKEFSLMAFVHENNVYPMIPARDHKRAYDNNEGPNTGGMGAYAPVPDVTEEMIQFSYEKIVQQAANGLMKEGRPFTGILYAGLIATKEGPKVIEFNTRFGDPETQVILPLLENDLLQVIEDVLAGEDPNIHWKPSVCAGVVVASAGYPGTYEKGIHIPHVSDEEVFIIQAGTKRHGEKLLSYGGRVLLVGSTGHTLEEATDKVYRYLQIYDDNQSFFYRSDIGRH